MKRLGSKQQAKFNRVVNRRRRAAARRLLPRSTRESRMLALIADHRAILPFKPLNASRIPLMVPAILSLRNNYSETVALIRAIRTYALQQYLPVDLYFDNVEEIEADALTVLTAEIHRCRYLRRIGGKALVSGTYPQNANIYGQLKSIGFFRLLNIAERPPEIEAEAEPTRIVLPFITDAEVTPERTDAFLEALVGAIKGTVDMDEKSQRYLYGAIIEATKNAGEHAYRIRPPYQAAGHRWWLTGSFDLANREVSILLFDQGAGIPNTLEPDLRNRAESIFKGEGLNPPDSLLIEIATRTGETSTGQSGRGKGFRTMRKFIDACDDGDLNVYSNSGLYTYARAGASRTDNADSLGGTLIQWRFRHSKVLTGVAA